MERCRPSQLRWTLTRVDERPTTTDEVPAARLVAVNTGGAPCSFDGYPAFHAHVGKGPEADAVAGRQPASRLSVAPGQGVSTDLYYSVVPDTSQYCNLPAASHPVADALPPNSGPEERGSAVRLTDGHGRVLPLVVCGEEIWMGVPTLH